MKFKGGDSQVVIGCFEKFMRFYHFRMVKSPLLNHMTSWAWMSEGGIHLIWRIISCLHFTPRQLLTTICGVVGSNKLCTRSIRFCKSLNSHHVLLFSGAQPTLMFREERFRQLNDAAKTSFNKSYEKVRLKWLRGRVDEDDGESDGETAALRESLQV